MREEIKLTPLEALEKYPSFVRMGWDIQFLGHCLSKGLLTGTYNRDKRVALINEGSLIKLAKYYNELKESQMFST